MKYCQLALDQLTELYGENFQQKDVDYSMKIQQEVIDKEVQEKLEKSRRLADWKAEIA